MSAKRNWVFVRAAAIRNASTRPVAMIVSITKQRRRWQWSEWSNCVIISNAFVWSVELFSGRVSQAKRSHGNHWHAQRAISSKATNVSVSFCRRTLCLIIIANEYLPIIIFRFFVFFVNFSCDVRFDKQRNYADIDECAIDRNACSSNQNCINLAGAFECECKTGFNLDKALNACVGKAWTVRLESSPLMIEY